MMVAYASRATSKRNVAALRAAGWRMLISPATMFGLWGKTEPITDVDGFRYAADNEMWTLYHRAQKLGVEQRSLFSPERYRWFMALVGRNADFGVVPDLVYGGEASLMHSLSWLDECLEYFPIVLLAVQNGMTPEMLRPFVCANVGVFVGGDSRWKEDTVGEWAALCREMKTICHVGRVNTVRRISICECAGATSFDGSSATKFSVTTRKLDNGRRQETLLRFQ